MADEGIAVPNLGLAPTHYEPGDENQIRREIERFMGDMHGALLRVIGQADADVAALTDSGWSLMPESGRWFRAGLVDSEAGATVPVITEDILYLVPFSPHAAVTATELVFEVTTGAGSSTVRIGLWDNTLPLSPNALLVESGDIDTSTTGVKTFAVSQALTAGSVYWIGLAAQGGTPTIRAAAGGNPDLPLGYGTAAAAVGTGEPDNHAQVTLDGGWTSLPDPAGAVTWTIGTYPLMAVKV